MQTPWSAPRRKIHMGRTHKHHKKGLATRLNTLKILSNKNTGSDRSTLKKICIAIIKSKLDYEALHIYNSAKQTVINKQSHQ